MGLFDFIKDGADAAQVIAAAASTPNATEVACGNPPPGYTWATATATVAGHWHRARAGVPGTPGPNGFMCMPKISTAGDTRAEIQRAHGQFVLKRAERLKAVSRALAAVATVDCGSNAKSFSTPYRYGWPYTAGSFGIDTLLVPYGFFAWNTVAFPITSLQTEAFTTAQTLTTDQQFAVDFQLYIRSQANITRDVFGDQIDWDLNDDGIEDNLTGSASRPSGLVNVFSKGVKIYTAGGGRLETVTKFHSVDELLASGRWVVDYPGYSLNPIAPSISERKNQGGALAYLERGGYFLDATVLRGEYPAQTKFMPTFGRGPNKKGHEFCKTKDGQAFRLNVAMGGYRNISVIVGAARRYTFKITPYDKAWYQDAIDGLASLMRSMGDMICANQTAIQSHNTSLASTLCSNQSTGKTCKPGEALCKCTPPTSAEQAAVTAANVAISTWCKFWTQPPAPTPIPEEFTETTEAASTVPWPIIVGGALAAGAILASGKS